MTEEEEDADVDKWFAAQLPEAKRRIYEAFHRPLPPVPVTVDAPPPPPSSPRQEIPTPAAQTPAELWLIIDDCAGIETRRCVTMRSHLRLTNKALRAWLPALTPMIPRDRFNLWLSRWLRRVYELASSSAKLPVVSPTSVSLTGWIYRLFGAGAKTQTSNSTITQVPTLWIAKTKVGFPTRYFYVYSNDALLCRVCRLSGVVLFPRDDKLLVGSIFQARPERGFCISLRTLSGDGSVTDLYGAHSLANTKSSFAKIKQLQQKGCEEFKRVMLLRKNSTVKTNEVLAELAALNRRLEPGDILESIDTPRKHL